MRIHFLYLATVGPGNVYQRVGPGHIGTWRSGLFCVVAVKTRFGGRLQEFFIELVSVALSGPTHWPAFLKMTGAQILPIVVGCVL